MRVQVRECDSHSSTVTVFLCKSIMTVITYYCGSEPHDTEKSFLAAQEAQKEAHSKFDSCLRNMLFIWMTVSVLLPAKNTSCCAI